MRNRLHLLFLTMLLSVFGLVLPSNLHAQDPAAAASGHAPDAPAAAKAPPEKTAHEKVAPQKIHVGILLTNIGKLDLATGGFSAEFYASFTCEDKAHDCNPEFDVLEGKISSKEVVEEDENSKTFKVKAELIAEIDLAEFPFDKQELSIDIIDKSGVALLEIDKKESGVDPDVKIVGWLLDSFEPVSTVHKYAEVNEELHIASLNVVVNKPGFPAFMKQFFPILIIMLISIFGLFIAPKQIPNRIAISTAGLLSAVMFHLSSTSSLPTISYLTRVDKVLFTTYFLLLLCSVSAVLIARFDDMKKEALVAAVHKYAMRVIPALVVIFYALAFLRVF